MTKLKLGRLPKVGMARMTLTLPEPLKEELERYAAALIPHMLEAFLQSDRGWRGRKAAAKLRSSRMPEQMTLGKVGDVE